MVNPVSPRGPVEGAHPAPAVSSARIRKDAEFTLGVIDAYMRATRDNELHEGAPGAPGALGPGNGGPGVGGLKEKIDEVRTLLGGGEPAPGTETGRRGGGVGTTPEKLKAPGRAPGATTGVGTGNRTGRGSGFGTEEADPKVISEAINMLMDEINKASPEETPFPTFAFGRDAPPVRTFGQMLERYVHALGRNDLIDWHQEEQLFNGISNFVERAPAMAPNEAINQLNQQVTLINNVVPPPLQLPLLE